MSDIISQISNSASSTSSSLHRCDEPGRETGTYVYVSLSCEDCAHL